MLDKVTHGVVELKSNRSVQNSSTCQSGNQSRVLSSWGLGPGLVSQVPYLGEALGVVGVKKRLNEDIFGTKDQQYFPSHVCSYNIDNCFFLSQDFGA